MCAECHAPEFEKKHHFECIISSIILLYRHFDAWGNRVDDIITSQAWKDLHSISAEEGLVALAYERNHQQWRSSLRTVSVLVTLLFHHAQN